MVLRRKTFARKLYIVANNGGETALCLPTYNLKNTEISPATVTQVDRPAGIASDKRTISATISVSDWLDLVKTYDKEFTHKKVTQLLLNEDETPFPKAVLTQHLVKT